MKVDIIDKKKQAKVMYFELAQESHQPLMDKMGNENKQLWDKREDGGEKKGLTQSATNNLILIRLLKSLIRHK